MNRSKESQDCYQAVCCAGSEKEGKAGAVTNGEGYVRHGDVALDTPERFKRSRDVGAYLGLVPRRHQSGEIAYSGRITKRGNSTVHPSNLQGMCDDCHSRKTALVDGRWGNGGES